MDKDAIRQAVWDGLEASGEARFPFPPHDRIPNFAGADGAANRLQETDAWTEAETIKANPDAPQLPVRRAALRAGKTLYMAVPRLREAQCFLELDPDVIEDIDHATTVGGSAEVGIPIGPETMPDIDLIVSGSVAVDPDAFGAGVAVAPGVPGSAVDGGVAVRRDAVGTHSGRLTVVSPTAVYSTRIDTDPCTGLEVSP